MSPQWARMWLSKAHLLATINITFLPNMACTTNTILTGTFQHHNITCINASLGRLRCTQPTRQCHTRREGVTILLCHHHLLCLSCRLRVHLLSFPTHPPQDHHIPCFLLWSTYRLLLAADQRGETPSMLSCTWVRTIPPRTRMISPIRTRRTPDPKSRRESFTRHLNHMETSRRHRTSESHYIATVANAQRHCSWSRCTPPTASTPTVQPRRRRRRDRYNCPQSARWHILLEHQACEPPLLLASIAQLLHR